MLIRKQNPGSSSTIYRRLNDEPSENIVFIPENGWDCYLLGRLSTKLKTFDVDLTTTASPDQLEKNHLTVGIDPLMRLLADL